MATPKIVLFYRFTPLADPEAIRLWQQTLAASNNLTGRILISEHGINATVGGDIADVKRYVRGTRSYAPFKDADIKWSDGTGDDFPRLSVKVRPEIVTFGAPDELKVDADGVVGGGVHLSPDELHELVEQRGDDVVFFDGRNKFEAEIGRFRNAVVPDVATTRDFLSELDSGRYDHLKTKPVVTYCTGGVRCEVLSALMRNRGFEEVYQIDGGIVRYGEAYGDEGLWDGSLYVFDKRMNLQFSGNAVTLGTCTLCQEPTSRYRNYPDTGGREFVLVCESCVPDA
ncbi:rhodanese-related sulfurtransferase [Rhodococcus hoagii]|uniref:oxygen-dependent tRNA uridine(34) hydroxylase TrhO n=1 Tax=Rhodococcus hoagii TaxID=43767 RepID=UPI0007CD72B6|nr:rhodanese-related sulfurtransferase [Prescottella equi]MBM4536787.1 rhodanese-related sulfurtransferase [Prescottella equi]NKR76536.1 rhodanese-related sulfurtransferase [Prescottella equi]NKR83438.1 rhodanese-related sulfurtransferase [Prescottella equi]NKS77565.1 rhodanese-related sulfurtransferase [Prescottella equi]NKT01407.1 rhodanese-related sulfurtransferase [Prescottella equi]